MRGSHVGNHAVALRLLLLNVFTSGGGRLLLLLPVSSRQAAVLGVPPLVGEAVGAGIASAVNGTVPEPWGRRKESSTLAVTVSLLHA